VLRLGGGARHGSDRATSPGRAAATC
jgi:hypothetical protein